MSDNEKECNEQNIDERHELNSYILRTMRDIQKDFQKYGEDLASVKTSQTDLVIPKLLSMETKIDNLDKKIRGNGKPGMEDRLRCLEMDVNKHDKSLYDKDDGVVTIVNQGKYSLKAATITIGALGSFVGFILAMLASPIFGFIKSIFCKVSN